MTRPSEDRDKPQRFSLPRVGEGLPPRHIVVGQRVSAVKLERAKELRREMTPAERLLWSALRRNQMLGLQFRRQQVIDGLIVDFYCHARGLVVEVDGPVHEGQAEYDAERDRVLRLRGLRVLRVRNDEVLRDFGGMLQRIAAWCGEPNPPAPFPTREGRDGEDQLPSRAGEGFLPQARMRYRRNDGFDVGDER